MKINQRNIFKLLKYIPHPATPNTGRVIVYIPKDYDFEEGDGGLMVPQDRNVGKVGVIVAIGESLPHLPPSKMICVGRLCALPQHPGLMDERDGHNFMTYHYADIPFFYKFIAEEYQEVGEPQEQVEEVSIPTPEDIKQSKLLDDFKEKFGKPKDEFTDKVIQGHERIQDIMQQYLELVQKNLRILEYNSRPTKDDAQWEEQTNGMVLRFNPEFAKMLKEVMAAQSVSELDLTTESVFLPWGK